MTSSILVALFVAYYALSNIFAFALSCWLASHKLSRPPWFVSMVIEGLWFICFTPAAILGHLLNVPRPENIKIGN